MGGIIWQCFDKSAHVAGSESMRLFVMVQDRATEVFQRNPKEVIKALKSEQVRSGIKFMYEIDPKLALGSFFMLQADAKFQARGQEDKASCVVLNTVLKLGDNPLKLATIIVGQASLHCHIDPQAKWWIADMIEQGLSKGTFRPEKGWENIIALLKEGSPYPCVLSDAGSDPFPHWQDDFTSEATEIETDDDEEYDEDEYDRLIEAFEALPYQEQWDIAYKHLEKKDDIFKLSPETWDSLEFGNGLSAWDLI